MIYLREINSESAKIFAIDKDRIQTLNLHETYNRYGEEVGHYNAGDYSVYNSASPAVQDCEEAIIKKFNLETVVIDGNEVTSINNDDVDYFYDEDSDFNAVVVEINHFIDEWEEENASYVECNGFTFWDGSNWQSIITSSDDDQISHEIIEDNDLIEQLEKAINEKQFEKEGFGQKIYLGNGYVIVLSQFANNWSEYTLIPEEEYDFDN